MKFLKYIFVSIVCVLLTFCTSNTILKKPDNLISKKEMADVLTDMLLASGGKNIKNLNQKRKVNYFPLVFEKYQIDSLQFEESSAFYISRIDDYSDILKDVNERLSAKKDEFKAIKEVEDSIRKFKKDSIKLEKKRIDSISASKSRIINRKDSVFTKDLNLDKTYLEQ